MKREQKSLTNKGFSLVELIIVVAIMAVLIGVLAPQYIRYVEKTRLQRDNSAIAEVANAMKLACAEEDVYKEIKSGAEIVFAPAGSGNTPTLDLTASATKMNAELAKTFTGKIELTSGTYNNNTVKLKLAVNANGVVEITAEGYISTPNGTADPANQPKF